MIGSGASSGSRPPSRRVSSCSQSATTPRRASRPAPACPASLKQLPPPQALAGCRGHQPSRCHPDSANPHPQHSSDAPARCPRCASFGQTSAPVAVLASRCSRASLESARAASRASSPSSHAKRERWCYTGRPTRTCSCPISTSSRRSGTTSLSPPQTSSNAEFILARAHWSRSHPASRLRPASLARIVGAWRAGAIGCSTLSPHCSPSCPQTRPSYWCWTTSIGPTSPPRRCFAIRSSRARR